MVWRPDRWILAVTLLWLPSLAADEETLPGLDLQKGPGWFLWAPEGLVSETPEGLECHLENRLGSTGWPHLDGVHAPLKLGMTVVSDDPGKDLHALARAHRDHLAKAVDLTALDPPVIRDETLDNGVPAVWLQQRFLETGSQRVRWIGKLFAKSGGVNPRLKIVTVFVMCSRAGWCGVSRERLPWILARHALSLRFDSAQPPKRLDAVLTHRNAKLAEGVSAALGAERQLKLRQPQKALELLRRTTAFAPHWAFGHMALALTLVETEGDLADAESAALESVALTERLWEPALDALATVRTRQGRREEAVTLINEILALDPSNRDYWVQRRDDILKGRS